MLRSFAQWLGELPIAEWVATAWSTLRQLGLIFALLAVAFFLVYLYPSGFTSEQRLSIIKGVGILALIAIVILALLTMLPGNLLYAPHERAMNKGRRYGTRERPLRRKRAFVEPKETEPSLATEAKPKELPPGDAQ